MKTTARLRLVALSLGALGATARCGSRASPDAAVARESGVDVQTPPDTAASTRDAAADDASATPLDVATADVVADVSGEVAPDATPDATPDAAPDATRGAASVTTLLVSGDFASDSSTAAVVSSAIAADAAVRLVALGDMSYASPYASNDPWAGFAARTYPVVGNHEFDSVAGTGGQQPYHMFNGVNAADNRTFAAITGANGVATYDFFYTHEVAPGWLVVALNTGTQCQQQTCTDQATRMGTAIDAWRSAHGGHGCVIAAMHTARWSTLFSSSTDNLAWAPGVDPIWQAAVAHRVDIVLQAHVHVYEEFHRLDGAGHVSATGVKLFTVGSGGRGQVEPPQSNIPSSALVTSVPSTVNGVLRLALYAGAYGYRFDRSADNTTPASSTSCFAP